MGRRLKKVKKRLVEISRATLGVFEMCKCRLRRVDNDEKEDIPVEDVSNEGTRSDRSPNSSGKTESLPQSVHSTNSTFTWHCLTKRDDSLHASGEPDDLHHNVPRLHYAESAQWATVFPWEGFVEHTFTHGAIADVNLVSYAGETFVRKNITEYKGEYEASVSIDAQCEFVAKVYSCFVYDDSVCLHLHYYKMKDLEHWMDIDDQRQVFTDQMSIWVTLQILTAIKAIHTIGILHMDIKPANILINDEGYPILTDFGGAIRTSDPLSFHCGTEAYLCPELLNEDTQRAQTRMADMWAAAVIYHELRTGGVPDFYESVQRCFRHSPACIGVYTDNLSDVAIDFLSAALDLDPTERLGFKGGVKELLMHDLFAEANWGSLVDRFRKVQSPLLDKLIALDLENRA